ncbi:acyl transferase [Jejudonia soesokkakensis]|uniref:Acyl transferase n=1 Tax=Jejudonia soesokkakensis TaxID=1323432 RepID=A0ABW2MT25_9FLAO
MTTNALFSISSAEEFEALALQVFKYQSKHVPIYKNFCEHLNCTTETVLKLEDIPFLPISFFKTHTVLSEKKESTYLFTSSGTTGSITSKHHVAELSVYKKSFSKGFAHFYGAVSEYTILALLPSYLEREGSSLVYMVNSLLSDSNSEHSGFYLHDLEALIEKLQWLENQRKKTILIGVSYALLDLIEKQNFQLKHTIVMETGGMKGRRKEMIKEELHAVLKNGFGVSQIHSEYGMTELLSQAYAKKNGDFYCPPWMKILTRDPEDALTLVEGKTGGINVIDLANYYSCSFIATQDLGKLNPEGSFKILGRFDESDIRGCNLMVL